MARPKSLVCGVGINDADYLVERSSDGLRSACPIYKKWKDMLSRCYSSKFQERNPTYIGCSVAKEWHLFSNFKKWMESQDWQGKQLDKDILFVGNKVYSAETCVFVHMSVNTFVLDGSSHKSEDSTGFYFNKKTGKFLAQCSNPISGEKEYLGMFEFERDASSAWKNRKHEISLQLASLQNDARVSEALSLRYA